MELKNHLGAQLELQQKLTLNNDMLQSLEILRLPLQDLREMLIQKTYENPLLELEDEPLAEVSAPEEVTPVEELEIEDPVEVAMETRELWQKGGAAQAGYQEADNSERSFTEMLDEQIGTLPLDEGFASLCRYLIACLDRKGYFREQPEEIARLLGCETDDVMQALYAIQSLEPVGVGARSLEECLLLQLVQSHHFNRYTIRLVKDGIPLLGSNNIKAITALLETDEATAKEACRIVRGLNPIPSQGYYTGESRDVVIPDATVAKTDTGFLVVYNQRSLPAVTLNIDYVQMIPTLTGDDSKQFFRRNLEEAKQLIKSVKKRENTLVRIVEEIVRRQPRYFEDGKSLEPMNMESLAESLELNLSTISRALQGKYLKCVAGTVEIRSMFTVGVKSSHGEAVSAAIVKQMIAKAIKAEDAMAPLSDESLRQVLELSQIKVSRRTVAKYREELGLPSSALRRRH